MVSKVAAALFAVALTSAMADVELVKNSSLEEGREGRAVSWPGGAEWVTEGSNSFFRLKSGGVEKLVMQYVEFKFPAIYPEMEVSLRCRVSELAKGDENFHDARVMMNYKLDNGRKTGVPGIPNFGKDTDGWVTRTFRAEVPENARSVEFMPCLFKTRSGVFDYDDISIKLIGEGKPFPVKPKLPPAVQMSKGGETPSAVDIPDTIFKNGALQQVASGKDWPAHWPGGKGVTYEEEDGNRFLRISSGGTDALNMLYSEFVLPQGYSTFVLKFKARYTDVKPGKEVWHDARIMMNVKDDANKKLSSPSVAFKGTSDGWRAVNYTLRVPKGACKLEFMPSMFQTESGTFDIDDLSLEPGEKINEEQGMLSEEDALYVDGPKVKTRGGREMWLQGVAVPSLEWSVRGERVEKSFDVAINKWNANVIRLPVKGQLWFGEGKKHNAVEDGGEAYRALVDKLVDYANKRGCYVIIDLHEYKAPTEAHRKFWLDAAKRYANMPGVMFGLLNEPHGISWDEWLNGGTLSNVKREGVVDENDEAKDVKASIGHKALLEAVRSTGAKNVVLIGGLDWAYDISGVLRGYGIEDPDGNGIIYDSHVYPWKSGWESKVLSVVKHHPVLFGEVGCSDKPMPFEKVAQDPYKWAPDIIAMIQENKIHWTAWSFHPSASPCVISDWKYTPTPYWGAFVKAALSGTEFSTGRVR